MWVERYREPGEFEIVGKLSSGLKDFLPAGTLISHADTYEVMIVENQQIDQTIDEDPSITISGRSFDSYLENRIVGMNGARSSTTLAPYVLTANYTWIQARILINDHILTTSVTDADDALINVVAVESVSGTGVSRKRTIDSGTVSERLMELLDIDDLGVKTVRINSFGSVGSPNETRFVIHKGVDRRDSIIFSWESGDLESANYLFSGKKYKNAAIVQGKLITVVVERGTHINYDRRFMLVDANDIDEKYDTIPGGATFTDLVDQMIERGERALKRQNHITITGANVSNVTRYRYRRDYNVGDLVMVDGNYGQMEVMRITEFAEVEDENGESGVPTLSLLQDLDA
jgi:hypothetical protein